MSGQTIQGTDSNFATVVEGEKSKLTLVDFWAPWCGPCRAVAPALEAIAQSPDVKVVKVNVDEEQQVAAKYGIRSIPTLMLFKNGKLEDTRVGALPKPEIERWLAAHR